MWAGLRPQTLRLLITSRRLSSQAITRSWFRTEVHSPLPAFRLSPNTTSRGPAPPSPRRRDPAILMLSVLRSDLTRRKPAPEREFVVLSTPNELEAVGGA